MSLLCSNVFTFGLVIESIKELGGASTLVRHEAIDVESTYPMPLTMSYLFLDTGGMWIKLLRHKHRVKGSLSNNLNEANCLGEIRRKVVKVALLSTLEVSIKMNKGILVLYCG
jgi:hypothetical protein